MEFIPFPKIPRLSRECVITEKIDGTNAQVFIREVEEDCPSVLSGDPIISRVGNREIFAGARSGWIIPNDMKDRYPGMQDNAGFAAWVRDNAGELYKLGPGSHFGEWWGQKIQRTYGQDRKRFSLFNVSRWATNGCDLADKQCHAPDCCDVVPVLYRGPFETSAIQGRLDVLASNGSAAAPGFMKPEGIMIYHVASGQYFKKTIEKDQEPKGLAR